MLLVISLGVVVVNCFEAVPDLEVIVEVVVGPVDTSFGFNVGGAGCLSGGNAVAGSGAFKEAVDVLVNGDVVVVNAVVGA